MPQFENDTPEWELSVYPGFMHGFIAFATIKSSIKFMSTLEEIQYGYDSKFKEIDYKTDTSASKLRFTFFFNCKVEITDFKNSSEN